MSNNNNAPIFRSVQEIKAMFGIVEKLAQVESNFTNPKTGEVSKGYKLVKQGTTEMIPGLVVQQTPLDTDEELKFLYQEDKDSWCLVDCKRTLVLGNVVASGI